jgi:hypothetical protein
MSTSGGAGTRYVTDSSNPPVLGRTGFSHKVGAPITNRAPASIMPLAALFGSSLARPLLLALSMASVARDLGWCDYVYLRWDAHSMLRKPTTSPCSAHRHLS